jgi:hypothetical protein
MKATFLINGNQVEIEGTPAELSEMLLGIPSESKSAKHRRKPAPQPLEQDNPNESAPPALATEERISYAVIYHQALGTSLKEYIAKDPSVSTDSYIIAITNKCRSLGLSPPPEPRLRKTIDAAKQLLAEANNQPPPSG